MEILISIAGPLLLITLSFVFKFMKPNIGDFLFISSLEIRIRNIFLTLFTVLFSLLLTLSFLSLFLSPNSGYEYFYNIVKIDIFNRWTFIVYIIVFSRILMELTLLYTPQYNFDSDSKFEDAFNTFKKTILRYDKSKMVKKQSFLKNTAKFIMKTVEDIWELLVVIGKLIYSNLYFIVCLVLYTQTIAFANYEDNAILYFYTILYIPVLFLIVNNKLKKVIIDPKFNLIKESSNLDELLKLELFGYVIQQGRGRNYILFNTDSPIYFVIYSSGKYFTYELTNDNLKVKNAEYLNNLTNTVIEVSDIMEELMKDNKE